MWCSRRCLFFAIRRACAYQTRINELSQALDAFEARTIPGRELIDWRASWVNLTPATSRYHGMSLHEARTPDRSEWRVIEPLLPNKPRGVPRVDDRRVLNGIFRALRSCVPWRLRPTDPVEFEGLLFRESMQSVNHDEELAVRSGDFHGPSSRPTAA
jgi:hypothetical protein